MCQVVPAILGFWEVAKLLTPNMEVFDELVETTVSLDFVGTRLHAGIRVLQHKRRSIILGIDNRAPEKAIGFNLPVCPRGYTNY